MRRSFVSSVMIELNHAKMRIFEAAVVIVYVCEVSLGVDGGCMPLPTRSQRYCDPVTVSLVCSLSSPDRSFPYLNQFILNPFFIVLSHFFFRCFLAFKLQAVRKWSVYKKQLLALVNTNCWFIKCKVKGLEWREILWKKTGKSFTKMGVKKQPRPNQPNSLSVPERVCYNTFFLTNHLTNERSLRVWSCSVIWIHLQETVKHKATWKKERGKER